VLVVPDLLLVLVEASFLRHPRDGCQVAVHLSLRVADDSLLVRVLL